MFFCSTHLFVELSRKKEKKNMIFCSILTCQFFVLFIAIEASYITSSVTRSGDLLDFGQLFKAFGNN